MKYILRDYQEKCVLAGIKTIEEGKKEVIIAPTAAGKALIISTIASRLPNKRGLVVQPNFELLVQGLEKINSLGIYPSVYSASAGKKETEGNLIYATPKSLTFETFKDLNIQYVIVDECDFATQPGTEFVELLKKLKIKSCLGLTATPIYLNQTVEGAVAKLMTKVKGSFFKDVCCVVQIQELVERGFWSDLKYYNVYDTAADSVLKLNDSGSEYTEESTQAFFDKFSLIERVSKFISRLPEGEDALIFVPSIGNAEELQKLVPNSVCVHSKVSKKDREERVNGFKSGKYSVAITPLALTVGFDKPNLKNIVDCTPTNSIRLYMQKYGRGVRISEGKEFCRIIDYSGNFGRFGDVRNITVDYIENYGWGVFNGEILLSDTPLKSNIKTTKDYLIKHGKPNHNYIFGKDNEGDAKLDFGKHKGKTVKYLYQRQRHYLKWLAESDFFFKDKELERQIKMIWDI